MEKEEKKIIRARRTILYVSIGVIAFVLVMNVVLGLFLAEKKEANDKPIPTKTAQVVTKDAFLYKGEEGKNALTLLKAKTRSEQNASGLVIAINGRKADDAKREFWAFYINGKEANVGPEEYITKNSDLIEWKILTY